MHILIFSDQYYPIGGGIQQYIKGISDIFIKKGEKVTILTRSIDDQPKRENVKNVSIIRSDLLLDAIIYPEKVLARWKKILKIVKAIKPDIIYANHHTSIVSIKIAKKLKIPVVYCCHGWGLLCPLKIRFLTFDKEEICMNERSFYRCYMCAERIEKYFDPEKSREQARKELLTCSNKKLLNKIVLIVKAVSPLWLFKFNRKYNSKLKKNLKRLIRRYDGYQLILNSANAIVSPSKMYSSFFQKSKLNVIPYGMNAELFFPIENKDILKKYNISEKFIVVTSRIHHSKGQYVAVQSLKYLPENIKLVIAGNSSLFSGPKHEDTIHYREIVDIIEKFKLEDRIIFTGFVLVEELKSLYSNSIATIVPSVWADPHPYVVLEAMSCGCPVVVTRNSGSSEAVTDGVDGFIVPRKEPEKIAQAVMNISRNRIKMGQKAREKILNNYSWDLIGEKTLCLLKQLAFSNSANSQSNNNA